MPVMEAAMDERRSVAIAIGFFALLIAIYVAAV
jgi:hypothetical protein